MTRTEIVEILKELIADLLNVSTSEISERSYLSDLGAESIDIVNLVMRIEERFGLDEIEDEDVQDVVLQATNAKVTKPRRHKLGM